MITYQANFDYEASLFDKDYQKNKSKYARMNREMEYIYFFTEKEKTKFLTKVKYPADYLGYLENLNLIIPEFVEEDKKALNWWGEIADLESERKFNSKITSTEIGKAKNWCPAETTIVSSLEDINSVLNTSQNQNWLLRFPYEMSGRKSIQFTVDQLSEERFQDQIGVALKLSPLILSAYLDRILDLGSTFIIENELITKSFWVENLIGRDCSFKGGRCGGGLQEALSKTHNISLTDYQEKLAEVADHYLKLGVKDRLQIDSFFYQDDKDVLLFPLVEANYRKSMGTFLNAMEVFTPGLGIGRWTLIQGKKLRKFKDFADLLEIVKPILYSNVKKSGIIPTSPIGNYFLSFFVASENLEEERNYLEKLWELIGIEEELPNEFLIGF